MSKSPVPLRFREKDSIGHELDLCLLTDFLCKPYLIANKSSLPDTHLFGNSPGNAGCCQSTWLGAANTTSPFLCMAFRRLTQEFKGHFGKLGCLPTSRLANHNNHLA